jgi:hypothetical protein
MNTTFTLTDEDISKINKFHPKCKKKYKGSGGKYVFQPNGIGIGITFICPCGKALDLTDVSKW